MPHDIYGYDADLALRVVEEIAQGKTMTEVAGTNGLPSRATIYKWLALQPKFFDAWERAKELSAQSLEEEALDMARDLKEKNDFTRTKIQAYNIAMGQLRWSAARRDKTRYGQQVQGQTTVPIQINTTLNLAQEGQPPAQDIEASIYTVSAEVLLGPTPQEYEDNLQASSLEGLTHAGDMIDLEAEPSDNVPPTPSKPKPPGKRLPRKHKSAAATALTKATYARKMK